MEADPAVATNTMMSTSESIVYSSPALTTPPSPSTPTAAEDAKPRKVFILDASVLIHDPGALFSFKKNAVCIPLSVINDLSQRKKEPGSIGSNSRSALRELEALRHRGNLAEGVVCDETGGIIRILTHAAELHETTGFSGQPGSAQQPQSSSDRVLAYALSLSRASQRLGNHLRVILVSKDIALRVRGNALNMHVEDYIYKSVSDLDEPYRGYQVALSDQGTIQRHRADDTQPPPRTANGHLEPSVAVGAAVAADTHSSTSDEVAPAGQDPDYSAACPNEFVLLVNPEDKQDYSLVRLVKMPGRERNTTAKRHADAVEDSDDEGGEEEDANLNDSDCRSQSDKPLALMTQPVSRSLRAWNITPRSRQQVMALDLLLDPSVSLVTLSGRAGTGKTLIALSAALELTLHHKKYKKVLVTRPVIALGNDIGYLPGSKEDKMGQWMQPIFDNLAFMESSAKDVTGNNPFGALTTESEDMGQGGRRRRRNKATPSAAQALYRKKGYQTGPGGKQEQEEAGSDDEQESEADDSEFGVSSHMAGSRTTQDKVKSVVQMEAITFLRGRSIAQEFVIVDEAQNATPHEMKTIISRAGEGTKIVLCGDPSQVDNPYLDATTNGLTYVIERLKHTSIHGHVTLKRTVRSRLAAVAAALL